jgi:uncharacterized protein YbaP (TraB family)
MELRDDLSARKHNLGYRNIIYSTYSKTVFMHHKLFKQAFSFFLLLILPSILFSQEKDTAFPKTFLWEIKGNGLKQASYLYGTIHVICPNDMELPDMLKQKIKEAKELFLEIPIAEKYDRTTTHVFLGKDSNLIDLIGESDFKKAQKLITDSSRMDLALLSRLKPFALTRLVDVAALNCNATSYEMEFFKIAKQTNIPILGLETIEEHSAVIDMIPMPAQLFQLKMKLSKPEIVQKSYKPMIALYKQKELWQLYARTVQGANTLGTAYKQGLLDNRNINWIPVMTKAMQSNTVFFAVGCAHLPGESGVINLLREKGYAVTPIFY